MNREEAIYEYEQMLIGKKGSIDSDIFRYSALGNEALAIYMFKYAFENIMHWTPKEAYYGFNANVAELLKLKHLIKYIIFPPEFDPETDYYFVVAKVYPGIIKVDVRERTLQLYQQLLDGKIKKFPKRFLEGRDGEMRALFCLKYAIQTYGTFKNVKDMYRAFSENDGIDFLKKVKLHQPCTVLFDTPVDFLHSSFSANDQKYNEFLYAMYKFRLYEKDLVKLKPKKVKIPKDEYDY